MTNQKIIEMIKAVIKQNKTYIHIWGARSGKTKLVEEYAKKHNAKFITIK